MNRVALIILCVLSFGTPIGTIYGKGTAWGAYMALTGFIAFFVMLFCGSWLTASREVDATNSIINKFGNR